MEEGTLSGINSDCGPLRVAIEDLRYYVAEKYKEQREFNKEILGKVSEIDRNMMAMEFKHNWKTGVWVTVGSMMGVILPFAVAILTGLISFK